ncbi:OmpA family protein [Gallaecimonas kandeliae]|uniref:flagellar protein MotY n=1 Tax=Gallaecimonas kandeliae TaxID=3029055 RepID=UPI002647AC64|nr:OmpA family protein [Gallaecimonas kandeliae]WKE64376.1 OmpA family protein [Gallaecimonas kandeliae]
MSKSFNISLIATLVVLAGTPADAGVRYYAASLGQSQWQVTAANPLQCRLEHRIPNYGVAVFSAHANRKENLRFALDVKDAPSKQTVASLASVPPAWQPGLAAQPLGKLPLYPHYPAELNNDRAWDLLSELESGRLPTLTYPDRLGRNKVSVALSTGNFKKGYEDFVSCLGGLLPVDFEDISFSVLTYKKNSADLTEDSQHRLDLVGQYLANDNQYSRIDIDAYSDSYGGRWLNEELSKKRAKAIKDYLVAKGLPADRISTEGYGEKRHVASNETEEGRALNRRVVLHVQR